MKREVSSPRIFNIIVCAIILLIFVLAFGIRPNAEVLTENSQEVIPLSKQLGERYPELLSNIMIVKSEKETEPILDLNYYINHYSSTIKFFSRLFDYKYEEVIDHLKEINDNENFNLNNIGNLEEEYPNFEYGLIEYFYNLNETKTLKRKVEYRPYYGEAEYVETLIQYYSSIYENVDKVTLLSIGAAESGYYKVDYMLKRNNVYGGMSQGRLITHNNIEQGVLSYVRLMSRNYYGRGLNTLSSIGRVYCPVFNDDIKIASPHWINLVTKAKNKYNSYTDVVTIENIMNLEEI